MTSGEVAGRAQTATPGRCGTLDNPQPTGIAAVEQAGLAALDLVVVDGELRAIDPLSPSHFPRIAASHAFDAIAAVFGAEIALAWRGGTVPDAGKAAIAAVMVDCARRIYGVLP